MEAHLLEPDDRTAPGKSDTAERRRVIAIPGSIVAATILAGLFLILASIPAPTAQPGTELLAEHIREFRMADTSWQRHVYQAALLALFALIVCDLLRSRPRLLDRPLILRDTRLNRTVTTAALAALLVLGIVGQSGNTPGRIACTIACCAVALGALALPKAAWSAKPALRILLGGGAVAIGALLILPGFLMPPRLPDVFRTADISAHYAALGSVVKTWLGVPLDKLRLIYGGTSIVAAAAVFADPLTFKDLFDVVRLFQVVFSVLLFVTAWIYDRSKIFLFTLATVILVSPFVSTFYSSMYYPNQSGMRYIGILVGLLLLKFVKAGERNGIALGLAAAALLFYNPETGIPVSFGLAFRQIVVGLSATQRLLGAVRYAAAFLVGLAAGVAAFLTVVFGVAGYRFENFSPYFGRFTAGYAGLAFHPNPWPFLMLLCGSAAMLQASSRAARGVLTDPQAVRSAIGTTLLIWLPYYVNRADWWNLWSLVMLLLFAAADWVTLRRWRVAIERLRRGRLTLAVAVVAGVAAPFALQNLAETVAALSSGPAPTASFSGMRVPDDVQAALAEKSATVKNLSAGHRLTYISVVSMLVTLDSGIDTGLAESDVFEETISEADLRKVAAEVLSQDADLVLFDAPDSMFYQGLPNREALLGRIKAFLRQTYAVDRTEGGWEIWTRQTPNPARAAGSDWPKVAR